MKEKRGIHADLMPMKVCFLGLWMLVILAGCNLGAPAAPTPIPAATVQTIIVTPTPLPISATALPSATPTLTNPATATLTASPTLTPTASLTPTVTLTPSITPFPAPGFVFDRWEQIELPPLLQGGTTLPIVVFTNSNDRQTISNLATAQPENTDMTVFVAQPEFPETRYALLELTAATGKRIFPAAAGTAIAYFSEAPGGQGLYILNLDNGLSGRVAAISSLVQRGLYSPPQWSPDGEKLALALATGYDMDIFLYDRGGAGRTNVTNSGAYDFFPAWSPDGRYLAFVSDRATCPSWLPGDANACDARTDIPPVGGQVYLLDVETGFVQQVADEFVTEPPRWINNATLVFAAGDQTDLLNPTRTLWLASVPGGTPRQLLLNNDAAALYLSDVWSPDGTAVVFQYNTAATSEVVMMSTNGQVLRRRGAELLFPRFGMAAAWSPRGNRIAIGGTGGDCPYGTRIADTTFDFTATGNPPPSMCEPIFSPNGAALAFTGINSQRDRTNPDGRVDVYAADANGFNVKNLSIDLRGSMALMGWLGGG